jgi:transposase-like protein
MTETTIPLAELLAKAGDPDFLRSAAQAVVQMLMEADVDGLIGAARHERTGERVTYRNGYRDRSLDTRLGALQLRIPKLRQGSYFPPFLEPRKTSEKASSRSFKRPGSAVCPPAVSRTWCKRWG